MAAAIEALCSSSLKNRLSSRFGVVFFDTPKTLNISHKAALARFFYFWVLIISKLQGVDTLLKSGFDDTQFNKT